MRTAGSSARRWVAVVAFLLLWAVLYFGVRFYLGDSAALSSDARLALALAPMPAFAGFLWSFIGMLRDADELERRIQLEALAIAFPLSLLLLTTLALVQRAVQLSIQDWSYAHAWPFLILFYALGVAVARRRYS